MKVILISGKAGHGKDTVANMIAKELRASGHGVLITHYADLLKYICRTFFDWDGKKDKAGRTLLQYVGTDVIRKQDPDFWVCFITRILTLFPNIWDYVIIPDARFPNEIDRIKGVFDTVSLRVYRPDFDGKMSETQQNHASETSLDDYVPDYYIRNDGTLKDLKDKVITLLRDTSLFRQLQIGEMQQ